MAAETRLVMMLVLPLVAAGLVILFRGRPNLREAAQLVVGVALATVVGSLCPIVFGGERPTLVLFEFAPGFPIAFRLEPLGMLFALVSGCLWSITTSTRSVICERTRKPIRHAFMSAFAWRFLRRWALRRPQTC